MQATAAQRPYFFDHIPALLDQCMAEYGELTGRHYSRVEAYRCLLSAGMHEDLPALNEAAAEIGYFQADIQDRHRRLVLGIFRQACEPLRHDGPYEFGRTDLAVRIRDTGCQLGIDRDFWHTPPIDALFLHRKIGGLYLLAAKLAARVDIRALFLQHTSR